MALIRRDANGASVIDDRWRAVADEAPIDGPHAIVSLARLRSQGDLPRPLGLRLPGDADVEELESEVALVDLIAIDFPSFTDGRGYSAARLLRDRLHFKGILRATGAVLRDQLFYLARVGFDEFALAPGRDVEDALKAFADFSVTYQPAADHSIPIWKRRASGT
jgi:uncharacterized protein (DUF934 family)